jgi:hypothetical protein
LNTKHFFTAKNLFMKTKALTQLVIILLVAAISCTKESGNMSSPATATSRESNDVVAESLDNEMNYVPVVGKWTLYYDWKLRWEILFYHNEGRIRRFLGYAKV